MRSATITVLMSLLLMTATGISAKAEPPGGQARFVTGASQLSHLFIENTGQVFDSEGNPRPDVRYTSGDDRVKLFFTERGLSYVYTRYTAKPGEGGVSNDGQSKGTASFAGSASFEYDVATYRMDMELVGMNPRVRITAEEPVPTAIRYYGVGTGNKEIEPQVFGRVRYINAYDNIDLVFYEKNGQLKYDFIVKPGGRISDIRIRYAGSTGMSNTGGEVRVLNPFGELVEQQPVSFASDPMRPDNSVSSEAIPTRFAIEDGAVSFNVDGYVPGTSIVIDPGILWSTFYGGSNAERATDVAVDGAGNVYVVGHTASVNFPAVNGIINTNQGQQDAFVMKINSDGAAVAWATYYGGSNQEFGNAIARDPSGNVLVAGQTTSANFPVTLGCYQSIKGTGVDAFILKLNSNGARVWATFYGGNDTDYGQGIASDNTGNVLLGGHTASTNLSGTVGAFQQNPNGGLDGYLLKLTAAGGLAWATYVGGLLSDAVNDVGADGTGAIYALGTTHSANFPVSGGFQATLRGINDAFIIKFNPNGTRAWATFFGGTSSETGNGISVGNDIWITGETNSTNLPVPPTGYRSFLTGNSDAYVVRINTSGSMTYGTYIGGSNNDVGNDVDGGSQGVVVTGFTTSTNYPTTPNGTQTTLNGPSDAFVSKLSLKHPTQGFYRNTKMDTLVYSTFFGGGADEYGDGVALEGSGNIIMAGWSTSTSIPYGANTIQINNGGTFDAIVAKFCEIDPEITPAGNIVICQGDSIELDAGPDYTLYIWYPNGENTRKIFVKTSGNYYVEARDVNGCFGISRDTVKVTVTNPPVVTATPPSDVICQGESVAMNAAVSQGSPPYIYTWTPSAGLSSTSIPNPTATPNTTTTYYITVTDTVGCVGVDSVVITVNPLPIANAGPNQSICYGNSAFIGTAGVPANTYLWTPSTGLNNANIAQPTASPIHTTMYILTVTTPDGCIAKDTMVLDVRPNLNIVPGGTVTICVGGSVVLDAGPGYVSYLWSTTETTRMITVNTPGVYTVTVEDNAGCIRPDSVTVVQYPPPVADAGADTTDCREVDIVLGGSPSALSGTPPYTYHWSPVAGLSDSTSANPTARPQITTVYTLTVTDANGCTDTDDITVTITPTPYANAGPDVTNCFGTGVQIGMPATGGSGQYTYSWAPALGLSDPAIAQPVANPFSTGIYVVTVEDNITGCVDKDTVQVNPQLKVALGKDKVICRNLGANLTSTVTGGTRPFTYQWEPANLVDRPTSPSTPAFPADSTDFILTVTDASGCVKKDTVRVFVNPSPIAVAGPTRQICIGESVVIGDTAIGGTPPLRYEWQPSFGIWATSPNPEVSPTVTTTYTVTVTDSRGCEDVQSVTVIVNPLPQVSITANGPRKFCHGESVVLTATPGFVHYAWNNGQEGQSITARETGDYRVTVTDANGCRATSGITGVLVVPSPAPQITVFGPLSFCKGGSVKLRASDGYAEYIWSSGQTTQEITVYQGSTYYVSARNTDGCWGFSAAVVVETYEAPGPTIVAEGPTVFCDGGQVTLDAGLHISYRWNTGATTRKITVNQSGTFFVTVKNFQGCEGTSNPVTVQELDKLVPRITPNGPITLCEGQSVELDAGAGYGTYAWNTGATTRTITVTSPGTFFCNVTSGNCSGKTQNVTVNFVPNPTPVVTPNGPLTFCRGGSVTLDAGDGYSDYLWSTGATTRRITVGEGGFYSVTVTNANGCVATSEEIEILVFENPAPNVYVSGPTDICFGKSVTITTGEGYASYLWSNGATGERIVVKTAGIYFVRVVDQNGCVGESEKIRVTVQQAFTAKITPDGPIEVCAGDSVILDGGAGYSSYEWSTGETTRVITVHQSGEYSVIVTNSSGCAALTPPVEITVFALPSKPKITRLGNTLSTVNAVSHQWFLNSNPIPNGVNQQYLASQPGSYTVRIVDANGCTAISDPFAFNPVGVDDFASAPFSLNVYPDPNTGRFTLEAQFEKPTAVRGKITNMLGQTVLEMPEETAIGAYQKQFNMEKMPGGLYFFHLEADGRQWIRKIVRQ